MSIDPPGAPPPSFQPSELQPTNEPMGIASMVVGIVGLVTCCCWPLGAFLGVIALGLGIASILRVKGAPMSFRGNGFAIAGISTGAVALLLAGTLGVLSLVGPKDGKGLDSFWKRMEEQMKQQQQQNRQGQPPAPAPAPTPPTGNDTDDQELDRAADEAAKEQREAAEPKKGP